MEIIMTHFSYLKDFQRLSLRFRFNKKNISPDLKDIHNLLRIKYLITQINSSIRQSVEHQKHFSQLENALVKVTG